MYLVLSALTSSPISLAAATKASAFSFTVCMLPPSTVNIYYVMKFLDRYVLGLVLRENISGHGDEKEDRSNRIYRKPPLLLKSNHLMVTRTHTLTSRSPPRYFRSVTVDNAFATNVSYSVGHLTSTQ